MTRWSESCSRFCVVYVLVHFPALVNYKLWNAHNFFLFLFCMSTVSAMLKWLVVHSHHFSWLMSRILEVIQSSSTCLVPKIYPRRTWYMRVLKTRWSGSLLLLDTGRWIIKQCWTPSWVDLLAGLNFVGFLLFVVSEHLWTPQALLQTYLSWNRLSSLYK
jgi:hypothetical protein